MKNQSDRELFEDAFEFITPHVRGKKVLLCGAVEDPPDFESSVLKKLQRAGAKEIVGVDQKPCPYPGITSFVDNLEEGDLGGPYDAILISKAFNHIGNIQNFIERTRRALSRGGQLIIQTPSAGNLQFTAVKLLRKEGKTDYSNPKHVLWHDPVSLAGLLDRCGYQVVRLGYLQTLLTWKQKILKPIVRFRPELAEEFMMVGEPTEM